MNPADRTPSVPVAIIGMGCLFPKAENLSRYWANICQGVDAIREIPPTHWNPADYHDVDPKAPDRTYARRGGFLDPVDFPALDFGIAPANLDATDTTQLLGLMVARAALDDAGYGATGRPLDRERVSVVLGVTGTLELVIPLGARLGHPIWRAALKDCGVAEPVASEVVQRIADSYVGWQENSFPGLLGNVAAGRIANRLDLGGTNCVVDAACASSIAAVHLAILELASGRSDIVLTGGLDTFNDIFMYMCFSKTPALSPTGDSRPFSAAADGTALGEGLGVLTLKRLDDARRDGDRIYAVIKGVGASSDGKGNAVYAPSAAGQSKCLRRAYESAGVTPDTIEMVEAHGTGTKVGDAVELEALAEVYRSGNPDRTWCALGSVKSQIGHTKAAAGAAGLIKAALALHHKVLPPTIKVDRPADAAAPGTTPFYVNTEARPWLAKSDHPRRAAVSAFGFGGSNFHAVLEEADPAPAAVAWTGDVQILAFSGADRGAIGQKLDAIPVDASWDAVRLAAARSRATYSASEPERLVIVAERDGTPWIKLVERARASLASEASSAPLPGSEAIYRGSEPMAGGLALLFPGQGSHYVGMLRELACTFPSMLETLCVAGRDPLAGQGLGDWIYPHPAFDETTHQANERSLQATHIAQPAIGAISLGCSRLLEHFGVKPEAVAGHSFGELTALCAAGRISERDFHALARLRGALMTGDGGDRGGMVAVLGPIETIEATIVGEKLDLVIANRNSPRQAVLSGPTTEIERAVAAFAAQGITTRSLDVSAAFHSRYVAQASEPLLEALEKVAFAAGLVPVFANSTASPYPDDPTEARSLLAQQLARPVRFVEQVESMYNSGIRTFVEVGPDSRLSSLVRSILGDRDHATVALDASKGQKGNTADLARCLAKLAALGHPVRLELWDEGAETLLGSTRKAGLTVKVSGANFRPKPLPPVSRTTPSAILDTRKPEASPKMTSTPDDRPEVQPGRFKAAPGGPSRTLSNGHVGETRPSTQSPAPPVRSVAETPPAHLAEALRLSQENLVALQRISEQTSDLHRQYLEGQERVQQNFQSLLEQQRNLTFATLGLNPPASVAESRIARPASTPAPAPLPPVRGAERRRSSIPAIAPAVTSSTAQAPRPVAPPQPSPAPQVAAPAPVPQAVVTSSKAAEVHEALVAVVSEKTGYPAEVLEPGMQLDADLGIDSIKRVEILAALQERLPEAPVIGPEHLGTIRTLGQIAEFLAGGESANVPAARTVEVAAVAPGSATTASVVHEALVAVVSEKTGYPAEVLEPGMQLDADLGIDSIKRVEILAALQERLPEAPVIGPEHLGTIRTLGQIAEFLAGPAGLASAHVPVPAATPAPVATASAAPRTPVAPSRPRAPQAPAVPVRRLIPTAVKLDDLDDRPPVHLANGEEVWVLDDGSDLAASLMHSCRKAGLRGRRITKAEAETLTPPPRLAGLIVLNSGPDMATLGEVFRLVRTAAPALRQGESSFVTVSHLGGLFGLEGLAAGSDSLAGGLAGLTKTAGHEWPEVHCKAIDFDPEMPTSAASTLILEEMMRRGPAEVGISSRGRAAITLRPTAVNASQPYDLVEPEDLVVITGGARGVTAEVAVALAAAFKPTIALLGRSPAPTPEPDWLAPLTDEAEIKRGLHARANGHSTPQAIGEAFRQLSANREIVANLKRIEAAGGRVVYRSVDVRDRDAVTETIEALRSMFGPVRGLIHGAGVLADRKIEDQTDEQFAHVFETKVTGLDGLLEAIGSDDLRVLALFSSTTARLGRKGQVAYAVANEVLNKRAQLEAKARPHCRVVSINWGPWAGGMVTPSLRPLFEAEGIPLIPTAEGAKYLVDELRSTGKRPVEIVIIGGGGPEPEFLQSAPAGKAAETAGGLAKVFDRTLDLESTPILKSHVMDGRPVLPMALILEWLAQAAMSRNPGMVYCGVDNLRLLKGVVLRDEQPETIRALAGKASRRNGLWVVPVELRGLLADEQEVLHARAEVILGENHPAKHRPDPEPTLAAYPSTRREIYREILFHGPDLHGIVAVKGCGLAGISATVSTAPAPSEWVVNPLRNQWLTDPLALDCAFQLMILWSVERTGSGSLPTYIGGYRQFRKAFPAEGIQVIARVTESTAHKARADIDFLDERGEPVARIEDYECVIDASLKAAFRRNRPAQVESK